MVWSSASSTLIGPFDSAFSPTNLHPVPVARIRVQSSAARNPRATGTARDRALCTRVLGRGVARTPHTGSRMGLSSEGLGSLSRHRGAQKVARHVVGPHKDARIRTEPSDSTHDLPVMVPLRVIAM